VSGFQRAPVSRLPEAGARRLEFARRCQDGNLTRIFTIGHGARDIETFLELLDGAGIRTLVDVRTAPGSRKHPQFGRDALAASLVARGLTYEWYGRELGGFRRAMPDSRHAALRSSGFRGYADHMETDEFRRSVSHLMELADTAPAAVMCAESLWWRCHRRMLADALVAAGCEVVHIMDRGRLEPHRLTSAARVVDGSLIYDVPEEDSGQRRLMD
jgi:uncharacterized protein (DUF488 family)